MKTIENKVFKFASAMQVEVSKNSDGDVLLVERIKEEPSKIMWLSNDAALDLATWILDNVSEVEDATR